LGVPGSLQEAAANLGAIAPAIAKISSNPLVFDRIFMIIDPLNKMKIRTFSALGAPVA
jgi:hypothetical protein